MPTFVYHLIAGAIGAFLVSVGRWIGQKYVPHFPDMPLLLSRIIDWGKPEPEKRARVMGQYLHLGAGSFWGLLYGTLVDKQFFFLEFNVVQGMLFGLIPWLFLMIVIMPALKEGFFAVKISRYHWLAGLVLHLIYGMVLGLSLSLFMDRPF